jgi:hypothetical protein
VSPPFVEGRDYCNGNKKVLLEDYTGHGCNNCPEAAVIAHELKDFFCERVVIISVHAGYFAQPYLNGDSLLSEDFNTEAGTAWDDYFGVSAMGNPNGLVDRVKGPSGYVFSKDSWVKVIDTLLLNNAKAMVTINNEFNTDTKILTTSIQTKFTEDVSGNYKLIVCITQDGIVAPQLNKNEEIGPTPMDVNYVHNHVLRKAINGSWGENLSSSGTVSANTSYDKTYTQEFADDWVPKDCHIVAFVYNEDTKTVLQVEELAVLE